MKVLNKVLSRRTLFLSEFVIFANPCLEEAEENVKRFMCKLNEMSTKKIVNQRVIAIWRLRQRSGNQWLGENQAR